MCDGLYTFPSNPVEAFAGLLEEEDWSGFFQEWTVMSRHFWRGIMVPRRCRIYRDEKGC